MVTRKRLLLLGALLFAAVALAACGGDGDDGDGGATNGDGGGATVADGDLGGFEEFEESTECTGQVNVTLSDFNLDADVTSVAAGSITFCVENIGPAGHEFKVIRLESADQKVVMYPAPPQPAQLVDEEAMEVLGALPLIYARASSNTASTSQLTVDLTPGPYLLICNFRGHYQLGTHATFTVE